MGCRHLLLWFRPSLCLGMWPTPSPSPTTHPPRFGMACRSWGRLYFGEPEAKIQTLYRYRGGQA